MSTFDVRFVRAAVPPGERDAALEGPGQVIAAPDGLAIRALARRTGVAGALAIAIAVVALLAVLTGAALAGDATGVHVSTKLGVGVGLLTLFGVGTGSYALLERALPRRTIARTIAWPYVVTARAHGAGLQVVTTARELSGTWTVETRQSGELLAALDRARGR